MLLPPSTVEYPREIGRGSHGVVYRGLWKDKLIAVKCISKHNHTKEMWRHEVDVMRSFQGTNGVPSFLEATETRDSYCIFMDHIRGTNGWSIVQDARHGTYVPEHVLRVWARDLMSIMGACHDRGYVYNDIKPANMLVTSWRASMVDFGSCRPRATGRTKPVGTPFFFAPEKFDGQSDYVSDIWSLGVSLYMMTCGQHPFVKGVETPSMQELMEKIHHEMVDFDDNPWDGYSAEFQDFLAKTMEKEQKYRMDLETAAHHPWLD